MFQSESEGEQKAKLDDFIELCPKNRLDRPRMPPGLYRESHARSLLLSKRVGAKLREGERGHESPSHPFSFAP